MSERGIREVFAELAASGLTPEQLGLAAELLSMSAKPQKTARQERNRRYYDSKKASENRLNPSEMSNSDASDDSDATAASQKETPPTPPKEKQEKSPKENPLSRGQKKRGCRLPGDWQLDAEDRAFAASKGLTATETDCEAEKFANYWQSKAGAGATKIDWRKTWQNWCITAAGHKPTVTRFATGPPDTKQSRREEAKAQTRMDLANGD